MMAITPNSSGLQPPNLDLFVPNGLGDLSDEQTAIPRIARDPDLTMRIAEAVECIPTSHQLFLGDSRDLTGLESDSVHLVLTSPPYWTLKQYRESSGQLGSVADYERFLRELDRVWSECFRLLVPGGRLVCVVGDVLLSRRRNNGRHVVVPLHASIQTHCRNLGFDNLAPIIWHKIGNADYESESGASGFLGKPYEPNAIIKNDVEYILFQRKPGGYRSPSLAMRLLSVIPVEHHRQWFRQVWTDIVGVSTRLHPAPFPLELAIRLVRMFSFVGDTVLDPFLGTGTTSLAASRCGRNSIGVETASEYLDLAEAALNEEAANLFRTVETHVSRLRSADGIPDLPSVGGVSP
ncbi:MAG: site-specific DNA-methyltransferase [Caldilineaceae bacterium SB0665_bin_21]|nr:site-specific DNA-methyltransferase [Caldilineaceae bacterium SB0665_bin_21]MYA04509.1 site-specific DNA-methyltransferase [Caldilineaceae bacterium SB0664_bin_22]MYC64128.1 site-specific DNA-methyltransferase [Caldilineaceae bacterium SB0661_bin_34]